ncbi:uncharacterized protein LOC124312632 [Daphnia pulicaria]|uniref:uncharacterized protein LOC124312632 n=1 Tax=Daphnia pulicaria TaxID=35523 RepID=UPI001EEC9F82|nr:uncharacterized protein LOC124312632 [Daphnia pulicaria]
MSEHSLSGNKAKNDKSDKPTKPALPTDSVQAIINYVTEFWRKQYTFTLEAKHIRSAISNKLSTEKSAFKKRSKIVASETARNNLTADDDGQPNGAAGGDEDEDDEIAT